MFVESPMSAVLHTSQPEQSLHALMPLLRIGCLLTVVGGYLDAYAWVAHNHVFANAQTGNVVFFGLGVAQQDLMGALSHLFPVLAFTAGVLAAKLLGVRPVKHSYHATLICLSAEWVALCALHLLQGRLPEPWFVPSLAFVVALQITSFSELGPLTFTSAMTTGNLLHAIAGIFAWLHEGDALGRVRGVLAVCIVLSFAVGACLGGVFTRRFPAMGLLPCVALLGVALVLTWMQARRNPSL